MGSFKVIISPKALTQLEEYIDYIQYTLMNEPASKNVWNDAIETAEKLETVAGSLHLCRNHKLQNLGYHPMLFLHHDYVMLYRIEKNVAYVEAIYHLLQDYENLFMNDI